MRSKPRRRPGLACLRAVSLTRALSKQSDFDLVDDRRHPNLSAPPSAGPLLVSPGPGGDVGLEGALDRSWSRWRPVRRRSAEILSRPHSRACAAERLEQRLQLVAQRSPRCALGPEVRCKKEKCGRRMRRLWGDETGSPAPPPSTKSDPSPVRSSQLRVKAEPTPPRNEGHRPAAMLPSWALR